jgi:hypothetical protein
VSEGVNGMEVPSFLALAFYDALIGEFFQVVANGRLLIRRLLEIKRLYLFEEFEVGMEKVEFAAFGSGDFAQESVLGELVNESVSGWIGNRDNFSGSCCADDGLRKEMFKQGEAGSGLRFPRSDLIFPVTLKLENSIKGFEPMGNRSLGRFLFKK